jgi:signal transduction histidine kinase
VYTCTACMQMGFFQAFVNHEVRNPLNVIKGLTDYSLEALKTCEQDRSPAQETISADKLTLDTAISDLHGEC